jgi:hypothetical protein
MALLITQEHTFTGRWSRVGGAVGDVPGQLTFTPEEGAHLTLDGAFDEEPSFLSGVSMEDHTIHGVTNTGKNVTPVQLLVFLAELGLVDEATVKRIPEVRLLHVLRESPDS